MADRFTRIGIELGVVTSRGPEMLSFYRDTVGLEVEEAFPLPDGGVMQRLRYGDSIVKIGCPKATPDQGVTSTAPSEPVTSIPDVMSRYDLVRGFRMVTFYVSDVDEALTRCKRDNVRIISTALNQPPFRWAVVEDPDGNWVEFVQRSD